MFREEIIEKIQKLMELAGGTDFIGEKKLAEEKIAKLLAKHQIEQAEMRSRDEIIHHESVDATGGYTSRAVRWKIELMNVICINNGVYLTYTRAKYKFAISSAMNMFGRKRDIDDCIYFYNNLYIQIEKMTNKWYKEAKKKYVISAKDKNQYRYGLVIGVQSMFEKMKKRADEYQQECGLVPVDESKIRKDEAKNKHLEIFNKKARSSNTVYNTNSAAAGMGYMDSKNLSIHEKLEQDNTLRIAQ